MTEQDVARLGAPFDRVFGDLETAEWFRGLLVLTLEALGVTDAHDPLLATTLRRRFIRLNYGNWWVTGLNVRGDGSRAVAVAMFADQTVFGSNVHRFGPFAKDSEGEPDVRLLQVEVGNLRTVLEQEPAFIEQYTAALGHIAQRFRRWSGSPYRRAHRPEIIEAARDAEAWRALMQSGLSRDDVTGYWWHNLGDAPTTDGEGVPLFVPDTLEGRPPCHATNVVRVRAGHKIVHFGANAIRAVSVVTADAEHGPHPHAPDGGTGTLVALTSHPIDPPLLVTDIPRAARYARFNAFDQHGQPRDGYLWPLGEEAAAAVIERARDRLPPDAHEVLSEGAPSDEPNVWLFQANPQIWSAAEFLREHGKGAELDFSVSRFGAEMRVGDTVLLWQAGDEAGLYAVGRITGGLREGEWRGEMGPKVDLTIEQVLEPPIPREAFRDHPVLSRSLIIRAPQGTNFRVSADEWSAITALMPTAEDRPGPRPEHSLDAVADATGIDRGELERWLRSIDRRKQAVLYGPPGTGKTFIAKQLAEHLVGGGDGFVDLVQFHPAYTYEDFIQGLRPRATDNGQLSFELQPGQFLRFVERARRRKGTSVLIIDEINRANLPRVFGELMYLLEYRDESMHLAGGDTLSIPSQVRILATMNTADRSIALVDHALRRRFAFLPLRPEFDVLRQYHRDRLGEELVERLITVVQELHTEIGDRNLHLGISYFLVENLPDQLEDVWRTEIEPYLEELFFDRSDPLGVFAWSRVRERLFDQP